MGITWCLFCSCLQNICAAPVHGQLTFLTCNADCYDGGELGFDDDDDFAPPGDFALPDMAAVAATDAHSIDDRDCCTNPGDCMECLSTAPSQLPAASDVAMTMLSAMSWPRLLC